MRRVCLGCRGRAPHSRGSVASRRPTREPSTKGTRSGMMWQSASVPLVPPAQDGTAAAQATAAVVASPAAWAAGAAGVGGAAAVVEATGTTRCKR
eukprot:1386774-Prymnesium_polylepis.1